MIWLTPPLILSDRTYRQLARFAVGTMGTGATPLPGGFGSVPVDAEIAARVAELRQGAAGPHCQDSRSRAAACRMSWAMRGSQV